MQLSLKNARPRIRELGNIRGRRRVRALPEDDIVGVIAILARSRHPRRLVAPAAKSCCVLLQVLPEEELAFCTLHDRFPEVDPVSRSRTVLATRALFFGNGLPA